MRSQIARMKGEKATGGHGHRGGGKREELVAEHGDWLRAVRRGEVPPAEFYERIEFRDAELGRLNNDEQ